jgi:hypothetical protein
MTTGQNDNQPSGSVWSSTTVQLSTLFVLMLIVVGIAIAIFHHGSRHAQSGKPPATSHATARRTATTSSTATTDLCSLPPGDQRVPSESYPQGVTWQAVGSMSVPQSSALGPQRTRRGINICFAHNPSGALLAAMNLLGEGSTNISEREVFDQLAINVPSAVTTTPAYQDFQSGVQIAGYKYDSYTSTSALLDVALRHSQGGLSAVQMPMRWTGNDWKYVFPPDGPVSSTLNGAQVEPPYVAWSAFS